MWFLLARRGALMRLIDVFCAAVDANDPFKHAGEYPSLLREIPLGPRVAHNILAAALAAHHFEHTLFSSLH